MSYSLWEVGEIASSLSSWTSRAMRVKSNGLVSIWGLPNGPSIRVPSGLVMPVRGHHMTRSSESGEWARERLILVVWVMLSTF